MIYQPSRVNLLGLFHSSCLLSFMKNNGLHLLLETLDFLSSCHCNHLMLKKFEYPSVPITALVGTTNTMKNTSFYAVVANALRT